MYFPDSRPLANRHPGRPDPCFGPGFQQYNTGPVYSQTVQISASPSRCFGTLAQTTQGQNSCFVSAAAIHNSIRRTNLGNQNRFCPCFL